jgi:hypothetical protein
VPLGAGEYRRRLHALHRYVPRDTNRGFAGDEFLDLAMKQISSHPRLGVATFLLKRLQTTQRPTFMLIFEWSGSLFSPLSTQEFFDRKLSLSVIFASNKKGILSSGIYCRDREGLLTEDILP